MGEDASIDDFVPAGGDDERDGGAESDGTAEPNADEESAASEESNADEESADSGESATGEVLDGDVDAAGTEVVSPSSVAPAVSTSRVVPDGGACSACEADAERLWFDDDAVVCAACKSW